MMGLLGSLFLTGILGSLGPCPGMCGPLEVMAGLQSRARKVVVVPSYLLYHGSSFAVYALLGALAGGIGSVLDAIAGGPLRGVAGMAVFGLATVPALLVVGLGIGAVGARWRQKLLRLAGALAGLDVTPHLRSWGVMIW